MSERTGISWCDSTFNPWVGCTKVSPACDHCYAERLMDHWLHRVQWGAGQARKRTSAENWRQPLRWNAQQFVQCAACGHRCELRKFHAVDGPADFTMCPACSGADWHGTRRRVFCAALADVFDNEVDPQWRADLFRLIADTPHLDWLLLTKRIGNVERMVMDSLRAMFLRTDREPPTWPWPHVWLGATICNQAEADRDIQKLLATPAAVRFLSIEPMLGSVDVFSPHTGDLLHTSGDDFEPGIDWVICGGESGTQARPMHPNWVRSLRDQCAAAGVPFHFKQWGEWLPRGPESMGYPLVDGVKRVRLTDLGENGQRLSARGGNDCWMQRAGTKAAGLLLDGVEHDGFPQ